MLWPDNHKLVRIEQKLAVAPDLSGAVAVSGPAVTSNEPQTGLDRKDVGPDRAANDGELYLRAERGDRGKGRGSHTVTCTLTDRCVWNTFQGERHRRRAAQGSTMTTTMTTASGGRQAEAQERPSSRR